MENHQCHTFSWDHNYQERSMEELRYSLLYTTLELETTRLTAQEEIKRAEDEVVHLKDLLNRVTIERNEAQDKYQRLLMEKFLLQQPVSLSGISSSVEDELRRGDSNTGISSSDCEESIVSSPVIDPIPPPPPQQIAAEKSLPEKGKFLQAVMKAGPLLQTLLLAGPLPQWQHPPPPLDTYEIPPVVVPSPSPLPLHLLHQDSSTININTNNGSCGGFNKKKRPMEFCQNSDSSPNNTKYQRIGLP